MTSDDGPKGLTVTSACARSGVSRSTLYRAIREQAFTTEQIGGRTIVDRVSLDAWAARRDADAQAVADALGA